MVPHEVDGIVCRDPRCLVCGGYGTYVPDPKEGLRALLNEQPWLAAFLEARDFVEKHSLQTFVAIHGEPHPSFLEYLPIFDGMVNELRHTEAMAEARREKAKQRH